MPERIATCCYCGRRAALVVRDHALTCSSCGAPLSRMKALSPRQADSLASHPMMAVPHKLGASKSAKPSKSKVKKKKSFWKKALGEIIDEIEDIFD